MSSTDPSEKNKHKWSPLKYLSHGQDRLQSQTERPPAAMSTMLVDRNQPLEQLGPQQQPYSYQPMYVNRDQPLQQSVPQHQHQHQQCSYQSMYVNRDQPLQLQYQPTPYLSPQSMNVDRDRPLSDSSGVSAEPPATTFYTFPSTRVELPSPPPPLPTEFEFSVEQPQKQSMRMDRETPLPINLTKTPRIAVPSSISEGKKESMMVDQDRPLETDHQEVKVVNLSIGGTSSTVIGSNNTPNEKLMVALPAEQTGVELDPETAADIAATIHTTTAALFASPSPPVLGVGPMPTTHPYNNSHISGGQTIRPLITSYSVPLDGQYPPYQYQSSGPSPAMVPDRDAVLDLPGSYGQPQMVPERDHPLPSTMSTTTVGLDQILRPTPPPTKTRPLGAPMSMYPDRNTPVDISTPRTDDNSTFVASNGGSSSVGNVDTSALPVNNPMQYPGFMMNAWHQHPTNSFSTTPGGSAGGGGGRGSASEYLDYPVAPHQTQSVMPYRDQPLSQLPLGRLPSMINPRPPPVSPQQPIDSLRPAMYPQSTFVQPAFMSRTSASQKLEFGRPEQIVQKLSEVYRWKFTSPIKKPGTLNYGPIKVVPDRPTKQLTVDIVGLEPGWYWIVLHIGRSPNLTQQDLKSLVIDVKQLDANGKERFAGKTCRTILTDYDKAAVFAPNRGLETRIRIHRQIEINRGNDLQLTIDAKFGAYAHFLHFEFMEIVRGQPNPEDIVIYGEGRPHDVIHIPQHIHHGRVPKTTDVHVCCVSDSRSHAVTLSFDDGNAYIHLWELEPSLVIGPDGVVPSTPPRTREEKARNPQNHKVPVAQFVFDAKAANHADVKDICLGISSDGLQIVIHSIEPDNGHGIPFRLFQYTPFNAIAIDNMKSPCQLKEVKNFKSNSGLKDFVGYGAFNTQDEGNSSAPLSSSTSKERYITCQGTEISMYSTTGGRWERLFNLPLCLEPNLDAAQRLYMSLSSRYFAWTGSKDVVSIWDLETGRHVSYIATATEDDAEIFVNFSRSCKNVAISVSGKIKIHQTHSGVLLGEYTQGLDEDSFYEVDFDEDYFMTMDQTASTEAKENKVALASCRHVVDTREEIKIVNTYWIHQDYRLMTYSGIQRPLFGCGQGSVFNLMTMPDPIAPAPAYNCDQDCSLRELTVDRYIGVISHGLNSTAGDSFWVSSAQRAIRGIWSTVLEISRSTDQSKSIVIPLGPAISTYSGLFLAESSHLVLVVGCFLQRWKLLASGPEICELDLVWKIQDDSKHLKDICIREILGAWVCQQGQELVFYLATPQWYRRHRRVTDMDDDEEEGGEGGKYAANSTRGSSTGPNYDTVTVPFEERDTLSLPLAERELQGVVGAVTLYLEGDRTLKRYVIRYLKSLVRQTQERDLSCIVSLARVWTPDRRVSVEGILAELLSPKHISWVPDTFATKENDPLSILMSIAQRQPSAIGASRVILDYCVSHAIESRNLSFLSPLFLSLHEFMNLYPEEASEYLSKIAFIPAQQRSFIINNHQVARPPVLFRMSFWKTSSVPLYQVDDPILQLVVTPPKEKDPVNDTFTRPVFMTSFDALWTYLDEKSEDRKKASSDSPSKVLKAATVYSPLTNEKGSSATSEDYWAKMERKQRQGSSWIRTGLHMIRHKAQFRSKIYVRSHDFNLEFFDNPAIAALVAYKWNTIGYSYWFFRFMSQCVFYALVYFAALFQVYDRANPNPPIAQYIAIIVLGSIFLWLEMLQAIRNWHRYKRSSYNFLDLIAYGLPIIASIDQIIINRIGESQGNTRILSFTVLIIFVHMLFEARVQEGICKYVTIIQEAVVEIKVFLVIFAAGLLGFAVAILHLFHGKCPMGPMGDCLVNVQDSNSTFPDNFLSAVSSTYFFMGGIYDPVSENFKGTDWAFHLMMAMYFFFTVILMLNVLIALINVAFIKGGDGWRLVWIESRLQYIEAAENMSYHIPGFRDAHDNYFPNVIYFTATWKQIKDYKEKYEEGNSGPRSSSLKANETIQRNEQDTAPVAAAPETPGANLAPNLEGIMAQLEALQRIIQETQNANAASASKTA